MNFVEIMLRIANIVFVLFLTEVYFSRTLAKLITRTIVVKRMVQNPQSK
jgi:hypothetical protein